MPLLPKSPKIQMPSFKKEKAIKAPKIKKLPMEKIPPAAPKNPMNGGY